MQVEGDNEITGPRYYVTLCVKTGAVTRAIQWFYNAKFKTLSSAENYREGLLPLVDKINSSPPNPKAIPNIEGERTIVITDNPAPNINYFRDENEVESKPLRSTADNEGIQELGKNIVPAKKKNKKTPEYVRLYHGPLVKKSTAKWLEKRQESASMVLFAIMAVMLLIALCNNQP